ncbi:flagellar motor switch protein FliN [Thermodesulfovibrionales bacterium]|nr:flagellar motor switch protein FliN [Thermodesulfovibrionales bacterium]MCL0039926.1 flagellar motor switch protein FliN [Thermodesulfovibrionales bacterium]MCL0071056.1 flagellar motor switch protein FliN [Thermodesulfovibrionales bacterium]MCL0084710.1 flagellar motor switch protein FliN [Thermodesulfovibrionales bacterium]
MAGDVKDLDIQEFESEAKSPQIVRREIDFILDVSLELTVVIGSVKMLVRELLQLGQGSVIALDKLAGEPMDVYVNDRLIGRGEVVVVNEKFGIRLTDIMSPTERARQLR